jgi:dienelactone hydrolase
MTPSLSVLSLLLSSSGAAQAAEVGTYTTSEWYETLYDTDGNAVWLQVHYPAVSDAYGADADPSAGPYPVIAFMHGYLGEAWMYDTACDTFASMGFVVVNLDTETGAWLDTHALARDARTALGWVDAESTDPSSWLAGMASDGDWTAMGHSMGGIAMAELVDLEPRVQTVVGFSPYRDADYMWDAYADFGGAALLITGDEDDTATPAVVRGWFDDLDAPSRGLYAVVHGAGHQGITDLDFDEGEALDNDQQLAAEIDLATAFLDAEAFGDEQRYDAVVCDPSFPLADLASRGAAPATSAGRLSDVAARIGLVARAGDTAVIYAGTGVSSAPEGPSDLAGAVELARVDLPDGVACVEVRLDGEYAGLGWVQAVFEGAEGESVGRAIDVFSVAVVGDDPAAEPVPASGGCATAPAAPWLYVAGLLGLVRRRRA